MMIRPRKYLAALLLPAALTLAACGDDAGEGTYAGYIEAEFVHVAPTSSGALTELAVRRGDTISQNDPLFALDDNPYADRVAQAESREKEAQARFADLLTGSRPEELRISIAKKASAQAALRLSTTELVRVRKLHEDGFASKAALDSAREAYNRDKASLDAAQAEIDTLALGGRDQQVQAAAAAAEAASAALAEAKWQLKERSVKAPVSGIVQDTLYREGEMVAAGSPVVTLLPPQHIKARFFVPEAEMGALRPGQRAWISCDGCGDPIEAEVRFVAADLEFTPPVIFSEETRSDLVVMAEAWPVDETPVRLRPGQPVTVKVNLSSSDNSGS